MSTLEITLSIALAISLTALVRSHRKYMIVRHLFIHFSDWCAVKIDAMTESASFVIFDIAENAARKEGYQVTFDQARDMMPYTILDAKAEWENEADYFQAMLRANGMAPLTYHDLDWPFNCNLAGMKNVPKPELTRHSICPTVDRD